MSFSPNTSTVQSEENFGETNSPSSFGACDNNSNGDDEDACLEEVQQGFIRRERNHRRNAAPKMLFDSSRDGNDNHFYRSNNSDSNSSIDDSHSRRIAMMVSSTTLPPRNNAFRDKHRRRTRSSSRRSSSSGSNNHSQTGPDKRSVQTSISTRNRSGSACSPSKRRSSSQSMKRLIAQSFDGCRIANAKHPEHYGISPQYSSTEFSSESSPDSSPTRILADMYRVQEYHNPDTLLEESYLSSSRKSLSSKSGLSRSGVNSPINGNRLNGSFYHKTKAAMRKSPSSIKLENNAKGKTLTGPKSCCLIGSFFVMILISLSGMVMLTNSAVPTIDPQEQFVITLPHQFDDKSLRGKKVLGRMWDTSATNSDDFDGERKDVTESKKKEKKPKKKVHKNAEKKKTSRYDGAGSKTESKTKPKPTGATTLLPQRLQMQIPPPLSLEIETNFDVVEPKLYDTSSSSKRDGNPIPRIVMMDPYMTETSRTIETYPPDFTDNTQLYGALPSDDERLNRMEMREPYSNDECVPMQDWQTSYQPSCNAMHELALQTLGASYGHEKLKSRNERGYLKGLDATLFGTKGFWRYAWKLVIDHYDNDKVEEDTIVFKNLKYEHNFEDAHFEHDRVDAVAMERLTSSPHVINIFGFCGHSVMTEYADGKSLGQLADKSKKIPLRRLEIARDIANGLADVHGIDGDGNATFVHLDVNPANVVSVKQTLKLNDFNIGIIRQWNTTSNEACGFPTQYPNPQWRSPEEARNEQHLTEKVDIFSLGHIFFRLICGHEPWNKLEPGGKPTKEEINKKVQRGDLPFIPDKILNSEDSEIIAIRDMMLKCYSFDPTQRPSAREIAIALENARKGLIRKYLKKEFDLKKKVKTKQK